MYNFVFLANDPGGLNSILPVATELSKRDDATVKVFLTGHAAEIEPLFKSSHEKIIQYIDGLLSQNEVFVLVTGTSWNSTTEINAIQKCKTEGVVTVSILDYWCNYKSRFAYDDGFVFPDYYFVMDKLAYEEAKIDGIDSSIMRIVGNPYLDFFVQMKSKKKKVLFLSQPISALYTKEECPYDEFMAFDGVIKACKALNLSVRIKFHPKETEKMKTLYKDLSVEGNLENIAFDYSVVVGMSTMGLLQCSLMGIPVISYEPELNADDKCIINKLNITKGSYSYEELLNQLKAITGSFDEESLPFWFDGKSTERCISELLEIYPK